MTSTRPDAAEKTEVMFTAEHWSMLKQIPTELGEIRQLLKESLTAIQGAMVASDKRCEDALKAANARIDDAHAKIDANGRTLMKWAAAGSGIAGTLAVIGWLLKFVLKIG